MLNVGFGLFFFFKQQNKVLLSFSFFLPTAHSAGVTGCIFFLTRVFIPSLFVFGVSNAWQPSVHFNYLAGERVKILKVYLNMCTRQPFKSCVQSVLLCLDWVSV